MGEKEKYQLDEQKIKEFHSNLIKSGNFDEVYAGTEAEFVAWIGGSEDKLKRFRNNAIADGRVKENEFGGTEDRFVSMFVKKKDVSDIPSTEPQSQFEAPKPRGKASTEDKPKAKTDIPTKFDYKLLNPNNITDFTQTAPGDHAASMRFNAIYGEKYGDDVVYELDEKKRERTNEISNDIAAAKPTMKWGTGGEDSKESLQKLEDDLNKKYNAGHRKAFNRYSDRQVAKEIRSQIAESFTDEYTYDFNRYLEANNADPYKALVTNPEIYTKWKKETGKRTFGEIIDNVDNYVQGAYTEAVLDNENQYYTMPQVAALKKQYGWDDQKTLQYIASQNETAQREHLKANVHKKQWDRYETQKEIDTLIADDAVKNHNRIYMLQQKLIGLGPVLYDTDGKRIEMPDNEDEAQGEMEINDRIDYFKEAIPNVRSSVRDLHNDHWRLYQNVVREYDKAKIELKDATESGGTISTTMGTQVTPEKQRKLKAAMGKEEYLSDLVRRAKLDVDATGRMLYMNENLSTNKYKGEKVNEFFDSWASFNKTVFRNPTKDRSTPVQRMEAFQVAMDHMGIDLSAEEYAAIDERMDGVEFLRNGAYFADLGLKMWGLNKVAAVTGLGRAVQTLGSDAKLYTMGKIIGEGKRAGKMVQFSAKNLGKLSEHAIMGAYEGGQFQLIAGDFSTGAMFYGSNHVLNGVMPNIINKNNKLGLFLSTMTRASLSMTSSMEAVGTTQAIIDSWTKDKNIALELEKTWGAESEWEKRVLMNLALSTIMGIPEMAKAGRRGLLPTNAEKVVEIQKRLMKEGKFELAEELGNIRTGLNGTNLKAEKLEAYVKKYEWLLNNGVEAKELNKSDNITDGRGFDYAKIDQMFNERAGENIDLWNEVLGKGANEVAEAKGRILKKLGINVDGKGLGSIEVTYDLYKHGGDYAKKWGAKIERATWKEDIRVRKEKVREYDKAAKEALKENSVSERLTDSPEAAEIIEGNKKPIKSEIEKEFTLSQRKGNQDKSRDALEKLSNEYSHEVIAKEWGNGKAGDKMQKAHDVAQRISDAMEAIGLPKSNVTKIRTIQKRLNKLIGEKKAISGKEFKKITDKIIAQTKAFTSEALTKSIETTIKKKSPQKARARGDKESLSQRKGLMIDAFDALFNRASVESKMREVAAAEGMTVESQQKQLAKLQRQLNKYDMTRRQAELVKEIVEGKKEIAEEFAEAVEGDMGADLMKEVEAGTANVEVYQAISDAMANSRTRADVNRRKNELREKSREGELKESEMLEYQMLSMYDKSTMSNNQLANAHKTIERTITEGRTEFKSEKLYRDMQSDIGNAEFIRDIAHEAVDYATMEIDPNAVNEIGAIRRIYSKGRMLIESYTTMMEYMMSKKPGREPLTGSGHRQTEALIKANTGKSQGVQRHINEVLSEITSVFGSTQKGQEFFKKAGLGNKRAKKYTFEVTEFGSKTPREMTIGEAMTMYAYMKQPDQLAHLEAKGYDIMKNGKLEGKSIKDLEAMLEKHSGKEAIMWVDRVIDRIMPKVWHSVNEQFKKDNSVDLELLDRFFPIYKFASGKNIELVGDPNNPTPLDFIRDATNASLELRRGKGDYNLKDFNEVLFEYIDNSMHYVHFQDVVADMNRQFKNGAVREVMEKRFSDMSTTAIDLLIADLAAGHTTYGKRLEVMDMARRGFAKAKLGINPTLFPKQMMSVNAFASEMSLKESTKHLAYAATPDFKIMDMLMKLPEIQARYRRSDFNRDVAEQAAQTDRMLEQGGGDKLRLVKGRGVEMLTWKNMSDNSLIATKWGDLGAILIGGQAMYRTKFETYTKEGFSAKEAQMKALKDFVRATEKTQQSGAIHNLSHLQRMGSFGKMITLFQNTPLQYARIEMGALSDMKNAAAGLMRTGSAGDLAKLGSSAKTFAIYHFVLPELFRAASNGFYLGDEDKTFMKDPKLYLSAILGSMAYVPILGAGTMSALSFLNEGFSFGTAQNIVTDMLEETDGIFELLAEKALEAGDPAGMEITPEDILKVINGFAQWGGIPTAGAGTWAIGIHDYVTDKTDDELALLGYSKNIYQGYMLSPNAAIINQNLPHNGGSIDTLIDQYIEDNGLGKFEKAENQLIREYRMYNRYGMNNSHVNFLYRGARGKHEKAMYLMRLFRAEVQDKHTVRQNYDLSQLKSDLHRGIEKTYPEFISMVDDFLENGVIAPSVYEDLMLMLEMPEEQYKEIFDFL